MTEMHTLIPGSTGGAGAGIGGRPDWSPTAQPPDSQGIIAHTPDPTAYHDLGGRVMIPRHTGGSEFGVSMGFSTKPGVVNIDPTDPIAGTGGITVDLEQVSKDGFRQAAAAAPGNPVQAWANAASLQGVPGRPQMTVRPAPPVPPMPQDSQFGFVVPHVDPSGAAIPMPGAAESMVVPTPHLFQSAVSAVPVVVNLSVKPKEGTKPMSIPQIIPNTETPVPLQGSIPTTQVAQPMNQQVPPAVMPAQMPAPQAAQQIQPPLPMPVQPMPVQPMPVQPMQPTAPVPTDPQLAAVLQQIVSRLDGLERPAMVLAPAQVPTEIPAFQQTHVAPLPASQVLSGLPQALAPAEMQIAPTPKEAVAPQLQEMNLHNDTREVFNPIPFLTNPPSPPKVQVYFDLGMGGTHVKRFHHVSKRGSTLSLFYDTRYDGDQFLPADTPEGETIGVRVPAMKLTLRAMVRNGFNQTFFCLDQINLIVDDSEDQSNFVSSMEEDQRGEFSMFGDQEQLDTLPAG